MPKRNWKTVQARDLRDAMDLCLEYAREKNNRSIDQIADLMGMESKWTLYKWIESVNMPVRMIRAFESHCGIDLVSRYLVASSGKLIIDIPRGRPCSSEDLLVLQSILNEAAGKLLRFYAEHSGHDETLAAVQTALEKLAWHRGNVEKYFQPELPFEGVE